MDPSLATSEAFIRALKGPSDPPALNSLEKVELAAACLDLDSLYVPAKRETITEWALFKLLKERNVEGSGC